MKKGFTLPDVLITLAVFGVFAALVLPPLVEGYQKRALVAQLRKSHNTISNGIKIMMAQEHLEHMYTESNGYSSYDKIWDYVAHSNEISADIKHMETLNSETILPCDTRRFNTYMLNDKSEVSQANEIFIIDVNGIGKPNRFGRDVFIFIGDDYGRLIPAGAKDITKVNVRTRAMSFCNVYALIDWKNNHTLCGIQNSPKIDDDVTGFGCAARIIESGWQMNY